MNDPTTVLEAHVSSSLERLSRRLESIEGQLQLERQYLIKLIEQLPFLKVSRALPHQDAVVPV